MINRRLSQEIYRELVGGKAINQDSYLNGEITPHPLFEEIFNKYDDYRALYANIGFELVMRSGFAFIRSLERDEDYTDVVRKIQALLLILSRGINELGYQFDMLTNDSVGVRDSLLNEIDKGEDKRDIMAACGMKQDTLVVACRNTLEKRAIAYRNAKGNLVLSYAGKAFFEDLFRYSPHAEENQCIEFVASPE